MAIPKENQRNPCQYHGLLFRYFTIFVYSAAFRFLLGQDSIYTMLE